MTNQKISFAVEDIKIDNDNISNNPHFCSLSVDCFATGKSAHNTFVTEETLRKTANTILLKPLVFAINKKFDDLSTHTDDEVPGGFVPHNTPIIFKTLDDGRVMMNIKVLVWRFYSGRLLEYFSRDGGKKSVSVEIDVLNSKKDESTGLTEILNFVYCAVTCLGDMITSAIPNAQAIMQFAQEFDNAKKAYLFASKYDELDYTIPESVKNNAKEALTLFEDVENNGKVSASPLALATARHLTRNDVTTLDKIRNLIKRSPKNIDESDINHLLWGGNDGYIWLQDMSQKIKELDTRKSTYFGENIENSVDQNEMKEEESMTKKKEDEVETFAESEKDVVQEIDMATSDETEDIKKEKDEEFSKTEQVKMSTDTTVDMAKSENKETVEDEKSESATEQKKEDKEGTENKFSITALDIESILAMLGEDVGTLVDECDFSKEVDFSSIEKLANTMYAKMCKMAQEHQAYMSETVDYADLKKFKAEYDASQMNYAVDMTLKKVEISLSKDEIDEARKDVENFSLSNIDIWKNKVFSLAYSKDKKIEKDLGVAKYGILENTNLKTKVANSPWPVLK